MNGGRRDFLAQLGGGLVGGLAGGLLPFRNLALAALLDETTRPRIDPAAPLAARPPHFRPRAKRVLYLFCSGALSQVDSFDWKPELERRDGTPLPGGDGLVTFQGEQGNLAKSPWKFRPRGACGKWTSDLLPRLGERVDRMCFLHGMTAKSNTHGPGENQMSTGFTLEGFPGIGSWVSYALGSECADLPAFVALPDPRGLPQSMGNHWGSAFLPAVFQGTAFSANRPIAHLDPQRGVDPAAARAARELALALDRQRLARQPSDSELAARIASFELAARMQLRAAEVGDLAAESVATRERYGCDDADATKAGFARNCLLARRLLESGVRFVQLFNGAYAMGEGVGNWDGHKYLAQQYAIHAPILDQPAAALLEDLEARGLLDETLVVFTTEFGRMPTFQKGASGRDHNPKGFTVWLAGAGVKAPFTFGATDEFGWKAVDGVTTIYDLHATILHLLGLDHTRLTWYHNGIERRLTDVHGRVIEEILA
ncbi:MAG: DUF1501 domain-containing protein [Planctomycetes bacterium]|nr:DUF1501 domain-containing protein [Planctomycetota bacterium]